MSEIRVTRWDAHCEKCDANMINIPVPENESALNAINTVFDFHAAMSPKCALAYQARWVRIIRVRDANGKQIGAKL